MNTRRQRNSQPGRAARVARPLSFLLLGALAFSVTVAFAGEGGGRIRRIGAGLYRIGDVTLDADKRTIRCPGEVNMDAGGPIELLACTPRGKTHESVFVLSVRPLDLQVALLLLDMREGRNPALTYPEGHPEADRPPGAAARILVEWPADTVMQTAARHRKRAERFLYNVQADTPARRAEWVFLGSRFVDGRFGADLEGSLITTYHDPLAILELALPTAADDIYYDVNQAVCPPVGTPVELIISAGSREKLGEDKAREEQQNAQ